MNGLTASLPFNDEVSPSLVEQLLNKHKAQKKDGKSKDFFTAIERTSTSTMYGNETDVEIVVDWQEEESETLLKLIQYVDSFENLDKNWDGYGAIPIYSSIIDKVRWFFNQIPDEYLSMISTDSISPDTNGTIMVDFENESEGILSISFGLDYDNFYFDIEDETKDKSEQIQIKSDREIHTRILNCLEELVS